MSKKVRRLIALLLSVVLAVVFVSSSFAEETSGMTMRGDFVEDGIIGYSDLYVFLRCLAGYSPDDLLSSARDEMNNPGLDVNWLNMNLYKDDEYADDNGMFHGGFNLKDAIMFIVEFDEELEPDYIARVDHPGNVVGDSGDPDRYYAVYDSEHCPIWEEIKK